MALERTRQWLLDHPNVLTAVFVASLWLGKGAELSPMGGSESFYGP